jgi:malonyl-ACP O-methyltransferase BioC
MSIDNRKGRIAARFGSAASTYDQSAALQALVAGKLARRVMQRGVAPSPRVLDIGCGTGLLTKAMQAELPSATFLATDLAPGQLTQARAGLGDKISYMGMDGEHPAIRDGSIDLVMSSLAAQWFQDPAQAMLRLASLLAPSGLLAVATLGPDSLSEWKDAHHLEGLRHGCPDYPPPGAYPGFTCEVEAVQMEYTDALDFLRALRRIGATVPRAGHYPLSAGALRRAAARLGARPRITYQILYLFRRNP